MEVIKVEDFTKHYMSKYEKKVRMLGEKHVREFRGQIFEYRYNDYIRILRFTVLCENNETDWIEFWCGKENVASTFISPVNKHQFENRENIENFCYKFKSEIRKGTSINEIIKLDSINILNYIEDNPVLKRTIS